MYLKFPESEVEDTDSKKDEIPPAAIVQLPQDLVQLLLPQKAPVKIGMELSYCLSFKQLASVQKQRGIVSVPI